MAKYKVKCDGCSRYFPMHCVICKMRDFEVSGSLLLCTSCHEPHFSFRCNASSSVIKPCGSFTHYSSTSDNFYMEDMY